MKISLLRAGDFGRWISVVGTAAALSMTVLSCDGGSDSDGSDGAGIPGDLIKIVGTWVGSMGGTETIDNTSWRTEYPSEDGTGLVVVEETVVHFDNAANYAIVQAPADDEFNPYKYAKKVWSKLVGFGFYYCEVSSGHDTIADAVAAENDADPNDFEGQGCRGLPWTRLTHPDAVE